MDLGKLAYIVFPLYLILLYLTIYDKYQYITLPLIAFINILVILSVMYGTFEPSDTITIIINLALIGGLFYFFANQSITWLLSTLFIGAASMGVEKPISYFNKNITLITMTILSLGIIMAAVAVSKIQSGVSDMSNEPIQLPKMYREGFEEIKGAILACLGLTVVVLGLNNTLVNNLESPSTESTAPSTSQFSYVLSLIFTTFITILIMIYNGIKAIGLYSISGIQYILTIFGNILLIPIGLFMNTDSIRSGFTSMISTISSNITFIFDFIIRNIVSIVISILNVIYSIYDMVIGSQYSKAKTVYTSIKPQSLSTVLTLMLVVTISAFNLNVAISQLYNGFALIQLPGMLNK